MESGRRAGAVLSAVAAPWYCMGDYGGAIARALPVLN